MFFFLYLKFLGVFFMDPEYPDPDNPDLDYPDRIRIFDRSESGLRKKESDPDPDKKDPDPKHWYYPVFLHKFNEAVVLALLPSISERACMSFFPYWSISSSVLAPKPWAFTFFSPCTAFVIIRKCTVPESICNKTNF